MWLKPRSERGALFLCCSNCELSLSIARLITRTAAKLHKLLKPLHHLVFISLRNVRFQLPCPAGSKTKLANVTKELTNIFR